MDQRIGRFRLGEHGATTAKVAALPTERVVRPIRRPAGAGRGQAAMAVAQNDWRDF